MHVSSPPRLDLGCPQAKTELDEHDHMFMRWGVDDKEYGHDDFTITFAINHDKTTATLYKISNVEVLMPLPITRRFIVKDLLNSSNYILSHVTIAISSIFKKDLCQSF